MSHPTQSFGFDTPAVRVRVIARNGDKLRGEVVQFDTANTDAATSTNDVGSTTSGFANVREPESGQTQYGLFGILETAVSDDQKGYAVLEGFVTALVKKSSGNVAAGDALCVATDGTLQADGRAIGDKFVAIYSPDDGSDLTTPTSATLARVYFSGIGPLGSLGASD